ncbi:hypothetical protein Tsubulata_042893 [Turnera subulata]|uniref:Uncharacterized protein n=1 Tax=Turnera subulata TaxID=218843 RepID=A0A9Q0FJ73_9ROSI|nr:hypothetical protein Tsubulata_042893 [Turnera subulata]
MRGLVVLKLFTRKLQRALLFKRCTGFNRIGIEFREEEEEEEEEGAKRVPGDVKKGHFAVTAVLGGEPKRFTVELKYLSDPAFLRLLEEAQEEYGFQQQGVLEVPCQPEELEKILHQRRSRSGCTK